MILVAVVLIDNDGVAKRSTPPPSPIKMQKKLKKYE